MLLFEEGMGRGGVLWTKLLPRNPFPKSHAEVRPCHAGGVVGIHQTKKTCSAFVAMSIPLIGGTDSSARIAHVGTAPPSAGLTWLFDCLGIISHCDELRVA